MADAAADGWLVEQGIGEERALFYRDGNVMAARLRWPDGLEPGAVVEGLLVSRTRGSTRGHAVFPNGEEALVDKLPRDASEGARMRFAVTRAAIGEAHRIKLAQVRPTQEPERPAPALTAILPGARTIFAFAHGDWEDISDLAFEGTVSFPGGSLHFAPTPAMVMVDVDGHLPPRDLALAAVEPLARAITLLDMGGMIGIDFPTLEAKADRKTVDIALEAALADFDHERTAMNGFGFVQIVARFERPSILHLFQHDRAGAAVRLLLRRAETLTGPGRIELAAHPAVMARLSEDWLGKLRQRTGKELSMRPDATLALDAPHAQLIPR